MKKWFSFALLLILMGVIVFMMNGCSVNKKLGRFFGNTVENTTDVANSFNEIEILCDTADVTIIPSESGERKVVALDRKKINYTVTVDGDTLRIKAVDERRWFEKIMDFGKSKLDVYIPAGEYGNLRIDASTADITVPESFTFADISIERSTGEVKLAANAVGNVNIKGSTGDTVVENVTCGSLDIKYSTGKIYLTNIISVGDVKMEGSTGDMLLNGVSFKSISTIGDTGDLIAGNLNGTEGVYVKRSTGDVTLSNVVCTDMNVIVSTGHTELTNVACHSFATEGSTGNITMANLIAEGLIDIERSTGDVYFDRCDAAEIEVETETGYVKGTLLTNKIFQVRTSSGKIDVPESWEGGKCKITTTTGSVKISIGQ